MARGIGLCCLTLMVIGCWKGSTASHYREPLRETKNGDIIIGGIFPVHESVNFTDRYDGEPSNRVCTRFSVSRMLQALMLVEAVEAVNRSPLLGNLTLGYRIVDSCADVTTAVAVTRRYLDVEPSSCPKQAWNSTVSGRDQSWKPSRPVNVIIGDYYSEISIAVARQLSINQIPQISYGSTTGILSDKSRFPAFMRTVPEDNYQARAIVDILANHDWTWVGLVTTDGDYGRYAAERFQQHARKKGICIAFSTVLPDILDDAGREQVVKDTIEYIEKDKRIGVIVSFAKADHMMYIIQMLTPNATGRIWIASDNWSTSKFVLGNHTLDEVGIIIGITLKSGDSSHFRRYLKTLDPNPDAHNNNTLLKRYLETDGMGLNQTELVKTLNTSVYPYAVYSVGLAVKAIAQAVADHCQNTNCTGGQNIIPWQLKVALRKASFEWEPNSEKYKFDKQGDLNTGYDVVLWTQHDDHVDVHDILAKYNIKGRNLSFVNNGEEKISRLVGNRTSRCAPDCLPGTRKFIPKDKQACCFECTQCRKDSFSNQTNAVKCLECGDKQWSAAGSAVCHDRTLTFFGWKDPFGIVLLCFAGLGVILTLVVLVLFVARWSTPVVKASVGPISLLLLLSLLGTFTSTVLFVGRPNKPQCQARQVLFGISFTLCVSCILVKSLKVLLAFQFHPGTKHVMDKLYQPYPIIAACVAVQVAICAVWLKLAPPKVNSTKTEMGILERCDEGNFLYFGLMLGYIGLLSLVGFVIAFMGRNLPDYYNEAKFITFSLLIYLIAWVVFGPTYHHAANAAGQYLPAVEIIVILFSAYGILIAFFFPKCYFMCFKKECNTKEAFRKNVRDHNCQSALTVPLDERTSSSVNDLSGSNSQTSLVPRGSVDASGPDGSPIPNGHQNTGQLVNPTNDKLPSSGPENRKRTLYRCATIH